MNKTRRYKQSTLVRLKSSKTEVIKLTFPFDWSMIDKVKSIPGRKYHPDQKCWSIPLNPHSIEKIREWGFYLENKLSEYYEEEHVDIKEIPSISVPGLKGELYPFQEKGVAFLETKNGRALIADEMGLGKTIQALAWMQLHPEKRPALIVCPASLKLNWAQETTSWLSNTGLVEILQGTQPYELKGDIIIINYDILHYWKNILSAHPFSVMVTDESHLYKNNSAKRTKAVKKLGKYIPHVIALSGTPIVNRPMEIFNAINLIDSTIFPNRWHYLQRYCGAKRIHIGGGRQVWDFTGATNTQELHEKLVNTCLPYNNLVYLQQHGPMKIGNVVNKKLNDKILSYDTVSSKIQWGQIQSYGSYETPDKMVRIKHELGQFDCSPDHRIWTKEKGYIRAEEIKTDLSLLMVQKEKNNYFRRIKHKCEILLNKMCCPTQNLYRKSIKKNGNKKMGKINRRITRNKKMSSMWKNYVQKRHNILQYLETQKILFNKLFQKVVYSKPNYKNVPRMGKNKGESQRHQENSISGSIIIFEKSRNQKKRNTTHRKGKKKTIRSPKEKMVKNQSHRTSSKILENFSVGKKITYLFKLARRIFRIHNSNQKSDRILQKRRNLFSIRRFSSSKIKNGNRNRWPYSFIQTTKIPGSLERTTTKKSRVENIEVLQPRNRRRYRKSKKKNFVYDLQVEKVNNYFTNGCLVHNCMIRRLKKDVLKDLPDKVRSFLPIELDNEEEYTEAELDLIAFLRDTRGEEDAKKASNAAALTEIETLKQLAVKGKLASAREWIHTTLQAGEKLVVFATHRFVVDYIMDEFRDIAVKIDGSVSQKARDQAVTEFQTNPQVRLFVGNIKAAGVGLTLTAASNVAFLELPWTPGELTQAEDRCHRIGQKDSVNVYYLLAEDTIEQKIAALLDRKRKVLDSVLDGQDTDEESLLTELIKQFES